MPRAPTLADKPLVAGIFLADDSVIVRLAEVEQFKGGGLAYDKMLSRKADKATNHFKKDLVRAFRMVGGLIPEGGRIMSACIAMPGPIKGSGTVTDPQADILTTEFHRKGHHWQQVDVKAEARAAISDAGITEKIVPNMPLPVLPDAAAYALGEYMYALHNQLRNASNKDLIRNHMRKTAVYAHLTIDEGIGGAIVSDGHLVQSRLHSEIGHLPLKRYVDDPLSREPLCKAHSFVGCAESYVSIPALRARNWNAEIDLPKWRQGSKPLEIIAFYITQICLSLVLTTAPSRIYLSGRVVRNPELVDLINLYLKTMLTIRGGQALYPGYDEQIAPEFICRRPEGDVGVYGCLIQAERSIRDDKVVRLRG
jgi:hypothetical protein